MRMLYIQAGVRSLLLRVGLSLSPSYFSFGSSLAASACGLHRDPGRSLCSKPSTVLPQLSRPRNPWMPFVVVSPHSLACPSKLSNMWHSFTWLFPRIPASQTPAQSCGFWPPPPSGPAAPSSWTPLLHLQEPRPLWFSRPEPSPATPSHTVLQQLLQRHAWLSI